jgi:hypothetical protein
MENYKYGEVQNRISIPERKDARNSLRLTIKRHCRKVLCELSKTEIGKKIDQNSLEKIAKSIANDCSRIYLDADLGRIVTDEGQLIAQPNVIARRGKQ